MNDQPYHIPALLDATIKGLDIKPDGTYVDVTFGGGGHSRAIMRQLGGEGRLLSFDQDVDAMANAIDDPRFTFVYGTSCAYTTRLRSTESLPTSEYRSIISTTRSADSRSALTDRSTCE